MKILPTFALAAIASLGLTACAQHALLQHPTTGQVVDCTSMSDVNSGVSGRGIGGAMGSGSAILNTPFAPRSPG